MATTFLSKDERSIITVDTDPDAHLVADVDTQTLARWQAVETLFWQMQDEMRKVAIDNDGLCEHGGDPVICAQVWAKDRP